MIHIHKVRAHTCMSRKEMADTLANMGTLQDKPDITPRIHIARTTSYWLAICPTGTHDGAIRNLHTFITKVHENQECASANQKYPYVNKWIANKQINQNFIQSLLEKQAGSRHTNYPNSKI